MYLCWYKLVPHVSPIQPMQLICALLWAITNNCYRGLSQKENSGEADLTVTKIFIQRDHLLLCLFLFPLFSCFSSSFLLPLLPFPFMNRKGHLWVKKEWTLEFFYMDYSFHIPRLSDDFVFNPTHGKYFVVHLSHLIQVAFGIYPSA